MLEGYITPLLMSYIDKYIKNIKPSDLQVSFWGGDAVLRNLELRLDVLENELAGFPLEIQSGKIRELIIHLPWNAIASTSVEVTIQDLELVMKMKSMRSKTKREKPPSESVDTDKPEPIKRSASLPDQQPGYLQGYLSRIINNGQMHIKRMVVKVIEEECDLMLTFNIGSVEGYTTDENWEKKYVYTDYFKDNYSLFKECEINDMTVNLHPIEGLGEGPNRATSHEPFVQRCSFKGRMRLDYRGSMFVKKTTEVLFGAVEFQVNENQFCLFIHLLDWLLSAYYSTKRLKRQDSTPGTPLPTDHPSHTPPTPPPTVEQSASTETQLEGAEEAKSSSSHGWGSWVMSFVSTQDDESSDQEEVAGTPSREAKLIEPSSSYSMSATTVTVTMNVTHKVQVPIFYSMRSFASPVVHVYFTGCTTKLETVPQRKLFLYTLGIMSVEASITGLCPCVKKFPSSWRRTSTASMFETSEKIPVFTSGKTPPDQASISQSLLKGSLFDPAQSPSSTIDLPPVTREELTRVGEPFKSLWISYVYFDVDQMRTEEECSECFSIGWTKMAVSPDVLHRLQHFWSAFGKSMEANPSSSQGKVVRGDPKAETNFNIGFAGGHMIFTPNAHFIPTSLIDPSPSHKTLKHSRKQLPSLPSLCLSCDRLEIAITQPMYSRNATIETPQTVHLEAQHDQITAGVVMVKSLSDVLREVSCDADLVSGSPKSYLHLGKCMDIPVATVIYNSRSTGDKHLMTSHLQLDISEASCSGNLRQIDNFLFVSSTWFKGEPLSSRTEIMLPTRQPLPLNQHLKGVMRGLTLAKSFCENYTSSSAILSEASMSIVKQGEGGKREVPVCYGPLQTSDWNTVDCYTREVQLQTSGQERGKAKLMELFIAAPNDKLKDEYFPVLKLEVSGCVMSLEPCFIEFLKLLPLDSLTKQSPGNPEMFTAGTGLTESQAAITSPLPSPSTPHTPHTLTSVSSIEAEAEVRETGVWSVVKEYELLIKTSPILVVLPSQDTVYSSPLLPAFPLLPHLAKEVSDRPPPLSPCSAMFVSLPSVVLESSRGPAISEVVERAGRPDSLPWDCGLASFTVFSVMDGQAHYLLDPLSVKATLAPQQEGSGVTVHSDTVTMSLSVKQVELLCGTMDRVSELVTSLSRSATPTGTADEGAESPPESVVEGHAPSHLSSPAPSTITHSTTLPAGSDVSTVSSFLVYQGLSSLWLQVLFPKLILNLYTRDENFGTTTPTSTPGSCDQQTAAEDNLTVGERHHDGDAKLEEGGSLVKFSIEVDGTSLQVDIQEKCTDIVFKLTAMEATLYRRSPLTDSLEHHTQLLVPGNQWIPCLTSSNGKLFSSFCSVLPESLSHEGLSLTASAPSGPVMEDRFLPGQKHLSPTVQSSFVLVTVKIPHQQPHHPVKLSCNVQPFEVCAWLPVLGCVSDIASPLMKKGSPKKKPNESKGSALLPLSLWPALDIHLENFRIVIPDSSYTNTLLLSTAGLHVTSSLDFSSPDVRFVTDSSAFRKLTRQSLEKQQPPLPLYQLDVCGMCLEGLGRKESVESFLCTSIADLRIVYSPPLSLTPPTPYGHKEGLQATGHCLEVNVTSDLSLFLGAEQLKCACDVFKSNTPFHPERESSSLVDHVTCDERDTPPSVGDDLPPFKMLLSGKTISVCILSPSDHVTSDHVTKPSGHIDENVQSDHIRHITPFVLALFYNPFLTLQMCRGSMETQLSLFNMAALSSDRPTPLAYSELLSVDSLPSLLESKLFEARKGQSPHNSQLPPHLLTISWSRSTRDKGVGKVSVDVGRPGRISLTPGFLERSIQSVLELEDIVLPLLCQESSEAAQDTSSSGNSETTQRSEPSVAEEKDSQSLLSTLLNTEVSVSTSQMVLELKLTTPAKLPPYCKQGSVESSSSQLQEERRVFNMAASTLSEGLIGCCEEMRFTVPLKSQGGQSVADLHVNGLQLLSVCGGFSSFVVAPVQLHCALRQHPPLVSHDSPQISLDISCGLLDVLVSQASVSSMLKASSLLSETLKPLSTKLSSSSSGSEEKSTRKKASVFSKKGFHKDTVSFKDDLRTGNFAYIIDESATPRLPAVGEIVFHQGGPSPSMTWAYEQPRALTTISALPVPFDITSDTPIKVRCDLQYWLEEEHSFTTLTSFHVLETMTSELSLSGHTPSSSKFQSGGHSECHSASRVWRVTVECVECVDGDEEEVFPSITEILDQSGQPLPLTFVLSPISLAANLRVDSIFSPSFVPLHSVSFTCEEFNATLLHTHPGGDCPVLFDGYQVMPAAGPEGQELMRMGVRGGAIAVRQGREENVSVKIDGVLSMEYVDFGDLVWRTAAYPTKVSGCFEYTHSTETSLDAPPNSKSLSISLASSPALMRFSQGLVHTSTLSAHVWLNSGLVTSGRKVAREEAGTETEDSSDGGSESVDSAALLLNHYIICNDTMEDLHVRQFSTDEDTVVPSGSCQGYSWRSHMTSPRQLQLCLVDCDSWQWTDPFSIDSLGVVKVEVTVRGLAADVYVKVTQLGGLQKQVTIHGCWKLFSTLPFPVEIQLHPNNPDTSPQPATSTDTLSPKILTMPQDGSLPSIIASEEEVGGVIIRPVGCGEHWSKVYPLTYGSHTCNRPQLLAEFPGEGGSSCHCWYNVKPMDYQDNKPWGGKITLSPLFAVSNHTPFDVTIALEKGQPDPDSTSSAPPTSPDSSHLAPSGFPHTHSETLTLSKGETLTLSSEYAADVSYDLKLRTSEATEWSSPSVTLSTQLLHHLLFSDSQEDTTTTTISLPLASGSSCNMQASFERSRLNTITIVLRAETTLTNHTPCPLRVMDVVTGESPENNSVELEVSSLEEVVLTQKEFVLGVDWNGAPLCSKPVSLPSFAEAQSSKDSGTTDKISQKLLYLNEVSVEVGSDSREKMTAEFLLTSECSSSTVMSTVKPAFILHNNTSDSLWVKPIMITGKVSQALLSRVHNCLDNHSFLVKQGDSEPVIFWNNFQSKHEESGTLTQVLCLAAAGDKNLVSSWSNFFSPKFVRHSFSLPSFTEALSHKPCLLTRHEADGITYLVVSHDPSPRLYLQNLCGVGLEVVECGTAGVNGFPQPIPPGEEVVYEPPSAAKLYPLVFDEEAMSDHERELKNKADKAMLRLRKRSTEKEIFVWSKPFPLGFAEEKVVTIPEVDIVFISTDKRGCTTTMSIIPTTSAPLSNIELPKESQAAVSIDVKFKLEQLVVCIDDEVTDSSSVKEVLRMYGDDIEMLYTKSHRKGTEVVLSMQSCQVDNMYDKTSAEYAVAMISRNEHVRRPSLVETGLSPVARLQVTFNPHSMRLIDKLQISTQPVTIQLEDSLLQLLRVLIFTYLPPGVLIASSLEVSQSNTSLSSLLTTPPIILQEAERDVFPLYIENLRIDPTSFFLNASITLKVFLSCNDTPFSFSEYQLDNIYSNWSEVLQIIGARYVSSAFMHAGWVLGSLEILGSPGTLIQSVGRGLRDLVVLPYQGLTHSPGMFVLGLGQGTASFLRNCSTGALSSVTNLASSISRNMEQLSMDPDHASYQEEIRRQASVPKFSSGMRSGVSSFGLSLISAVAGIVDQPMQSFQQMDEEFTTLGATRSILAGVGKGLLGVVTKPMGGAMELVSKTGQGIMHGTGLARNLRHREVREGLQSVGAILKQDLPGTILKYVRKLSNYHYLIAIPSTRLVSNPPSSPTCIILLTPNSLHFVDLQSDSILQNISLQEMDVTEHANSGTEGMVRLHFRHITTTQQTDQPSDFQAIEYYLNLSSNESSLKEQLSSTTDDNSDTEGSGTETNEGTSDVYLTTVHHSAQFLSLYQFARQYLLDSDCRFSVHMSGTL